MHPIRTTHSYLQAIPHIITFKVISSFILLGLTEVLRQVTGWALLSVGRVAVTTGDYTFLFTTWQGIIILVLGLITLYLYFAFDIVMMIIVAHRWIQNEKAPLLETMRAGLVDASKFLTPAGLPILLFITLVTPFVGFGLSVSLTENLHMPDFITSVIYATPLYHYAYLAVLLILTVIAFFGLFVVHGVVVSNLPVKDTYRNSFRIIRENWLNLIGNMLLFWFVTGLFVLLVLALAGMTYPVALEYFIENDETNRMAMLFTVGLGLYVVLVFLSVFTPLNIMRMTELYESYVQGTRVRALSHRFSPHPIVWIINLAALAACALFGYFGNVYFDEIFPLESQVAVIAHRAGGSESVENTAIALETAVKDDAWGAEIDIQRTADGAYIVNHDDNFLRTTGNPHTPSQMTLAEIRQLTVANTSGSGEPGQPVSTYEEMLDGCRDRLVLFVELKGATADRQMADDAVRIAREKGMLDQCVFISLKYDLISYLEATYPDIQTGFLAFASYGDVAALDCDYLALEEQAATSSVISAVHDQGKKVAVWTVNGQGAQHSFLLSDADAIITDNMAQAKSEKEAIAHRARYERVLDTIVETFFR